MSHHHLSQRNPFMPTSTMGRILATDRTLPPGWEIDFILAGPAEALDILDYVQAGDHATVDHLSGIPLGNQETPGLTFVLRHLRRPINRDSLRPDGLRPPLGYSITESKRAQQLKQYPFNYE